MRYRYGAGIKHQTSTPLHALLTGASMLGWQWKSICANRRDILKRR